MILNHRFDPGPIAPARFCIPAGSSSVVAAVVAAASRPGRNISSRCTVQTLSRSSRCDRIPPNVQIFGTTSFLERFPPET